MTIPITPRRPLDDDQPKGYRESDKDFVLNNLDACVTLLEAMTEPITPENHRARHELLHHYLDELLADYFSDQLVFGSEHMKSLNNRIEELMTWAYEQTIKPTERDQ